MLRTLLLVATVVATSRAAAEPVRMERRRMIAIALPDDLFITNHDTTFPLPVVHVGYQLQRRLLGEAAAGFLPLRYGAYAALVHAGARYTLRDGLFAPYLLGRVGAYVDRPDEGDGGTYPFVLAGGGIELAARGGFAAWVEAGIGGVSFENNRERSTELGVWISAGGGYRF